MYWFPLSIASLLPPLTLLILSFALLLLLYREEDMLNGYSEKSRLYKRLLRISVTIALLTLTAVCYNHLFESVPELKALITMFNLQP